MFEPTPAQESARHLLRVVHGDTPSAGGAPIDDEAPIHDALAELGYVDLSDFDELTRTTRAQVRYLAALFPHETSLVRLGNLISALIDNGRITPEDVRLILENRSLADPSRRYDGVPYQRIQLVGQMLIAGHSRREIARVTAVSVDTVTAIDEFLGISEKRHSRFVQWAIDAVREGVSVRQFAAVTGLPRSTAHRVMKEGRSVLVELGEVAS